MQNALMAIWNHKRSTDESSSRHLCPKGNNSWCGFQRDIANDTNYYRHDDPLPAVVADEIKFVFDALSKESLLVLCLHGVTQNQNESFNGLIWQCGPKITHSGLHTVDLATHLAIGIFHDGTKKIFNILKELGVEPGTLCRKLCTRIDEEGKYHATNKSTDKAKKRRKTIRNRKKGYSEVQKVREEVQYDAGAF